MTERTTILCSPSQANTAKQCLRLWGFRYLDKIRSPPTAGQAKGTALHEIGENWLRDGLIPPPGDIGVRFLSGIHHLPKPSPDLLVEHAFLFEDGDVHWRGFIDCVDPTGDVVVVIDHKSTKNFYWAKSPDDLMSDTQSTIYAKAIMALFGVDTIEARWVYYLMEGQPSAKKVSITLTKDHVEKEYRGLKILGNELLRLKKTTESGLDIPTKYPKAACKAFGGCDFGEICAAKKEGQDMSDLLSRLKKMKDNGVDHGVQAAAVAINPPTTVMPPRPEPTPPPETPPVEEPQEAPPMQMEEAAPKGRGRGRPKGSKNKPKTEAKPLAEVMADDWSADAATTAEAGTSFRYARFAAAVENTCILFINCIPDAGANSVNNLLQRAADKAAQENGVAHYRSIEYGAGAGSLCAALKEILSTEEPIKGNWFVTTDNQMHKDALPTLEELADYVVRGTR
tara:strand:+ start:1191 stop:2549 length:1359 start_codon:yes stop_codon:yes gene_type:complete